MTWHWTCFARRIAINERKRLTKPPSRESMAVGEDRNNEVSLYRPVQTKKRKFNSVRYGV